MKKIFAIAAVLVSLAGCAGNKDVCHIEGGERNQHEVCVRK